MALARRIRVYFTPLTIQFVCQKVGRAGVEKVTTGLHGEREKERIVSRANLCIAVVFTGAADMYVREYYNKIDILSLRGRPQTRR